MEGSKSRRLKVIADSKSTAFLLPPFQAYRCPFDSETPKVRERERKKRGRFGFESWNSQWTERERARVFTLSPLIRVPTELDLIPVERVWERYGQAPILTVHSSVLVNLDCSIWNWCDSNHVPPYFSGPCQSTDYVLNSYVISLLFFFSPL